MSRVVGVFVFLTAAVGVASAAAPAAAQAGAAPGGSGKTFELLLSLEHPRGLDRAVKRVSNPSSKAYRDFMTIEQVAKRFGAGKASKRAVRRWVAARGGTVRIASTGDFALAEVPAPTAARLRAPGKAGDALEVPDALAHAVTAVEPVDRAPAVRSGPPKPPPLAQRDSQAPHSGTTAGCLDGVNAPAPPPGNAFTPNQYLDAYGHSTLHRKGITGKGVRFAVIEIDGYAQTDIDTFGQCFGIRIPPINPHAVGIPGLLAPGDETTLDLELLSAGAPGAKSIEVWENDGTNVGLLEAVAASLAKKKLRPDVISISLGGCEADLTDSFATTRLLNRVFGAAAAAGISTFVSSGDQGSSACERPPVALDLLSVNSPAHSQYVTAVGGTNVTLDPANQIVQQVVWNDSPAKFAGGGGGFSTVFETPWWQRPAKRLGNGARTLPDIAALADVTPGYVIYCTSVPCHQFAQTVPGWTAVGGTSAAAPLMASGVALANEVARKAKQPPVGFINPLIYDVASTKGGAKVLSDVTIGDNDLGLMLTPPNGDPPKPLGCCTAGPGYDLASGLGSLKIAGFSRLASRAAP
jgi:kumamolisin